MPEQGQDIPQPKEFSFATRLENFVRENSDFKQIFESGLKSHLNKLQASARTEEEEKPEIKEAQKKFEELSRVIASGFDGFELRAYKGEPKKGSVIMFFAKPEDLREDDPTKLNIDTGKEKYEYEVVLSKADWNSYSQSPEKVLTGRKFHMEICERSLFVHPRLEDIILRKHDGFSVNLAVTGECTGKGTKYDGIMPYDSRNTYDIECPTSDRLLSQIDSLGI